MNERLLSLDVFRGMTIFLMILVNTPGSWNYVYAPLLHAPWHGCTPTDLVFPFFMFIVGVSMAISYSKFQLENRIWIQKAIKRGSIIILIGLLLNWFPFYDKNINDLRVFGVLQRIGMAFIPAAIMISWAKPKLIPYVIMLILVSYWAILGLDSPAPFTLEDNVVKKIDIWLVGANHMYKGYGVPFDPEGFLSTLPSIATILIGYIVGCEILSKITLLNKIQRLLWAGSILIALGYFWHLLGFPLNKPLWSSSYVLFTAGLAMIFLSILIIIIDINKFASWTYIFKAFGQNPLATFILAGLLTKIISRIKIENESLYAWTYKTIYQSTFGNYLGSFLFALTMVMVIGCVAWYLDKKNIMIKV